MSRDVVVTFPEGNEVRMLWSVKSRELHIELSEQSLRFCFESLANSRPEEKKKKQKKDPAEPDEEAEAMSPPKRKKRRLKRRSSHADSEHHDIGG